MLVMLITKKKVIKKSGDRMIYRHEKWGEDKQYNLSQNGWSTWILVEYSKGCRKSALTLTDLEKDQFIKRLEDNGWYGNSRS